MSHLHPSRLSGAHPAGWATVVALFLTAACSDSTAPRPEDDPGPPSADLAATQYPILVGAGDIATCSSSLGDEKSAAAMDGVIARYPSATVFTAGDNVYDNGTAAEYQNCYEPSWGRFKARTRPTLGNHEYKSGTATPSFDYFGDSAWGGSRARGGYYSYDLGASWHIVVLNSNNSFVSTASTSAQASWLRADLAANTRPCVAAMWHHPLYYSSIDTASNLRDSSVRPFWTELYAAGADLILNGHHHGYERFLPMTPTGTVDTAKGLRQFIVGTGGAGLGPVVKIHPNSLVRNGTSYGVLQLTLEDDSFDWNFVPEAGKTFTDAGSARCHRAPPPPPPSNVPPTAGFTWVCTALNCTFTDGSSDPDGTVSARSWNFGDGTTSTATNPAHGYAAAGSYTVTLTVTDDGGATNTTSQTVATTAGSGNAPPTAAFTQSCSGLNCSFTDGSSDPDGTVSARSWNFGDGTTSTATSPAHSYAAAGSYTVTLTVTDNRGASATTSRVVTVSAPPPPPPPPPANQAPSAYFGSACTRLTCTFTDRSKDPDGTIVAWLWNFGDGTSSGSRNPVHTYPKGGTYKPRLTVTDNAGATGTILHIITIAP